MNPKIHPCDNFYDFACGRWTLANPVPDGKAMWGMFNQLEQASQLIIRNILGKWVTSYWFSFSKTLQPTDFVVNWREKDKYLLNLKKKALKVDIIYFLN